MFNSTVDMGAYEWNGQPMLLVCESDPVTGATRFRYGSPVTWSVTAPTVNGSTQYLGAGWTLSPGATGTGSATHVPVQFANDSALTWNWATQYRFECVSSKPAIGGVAGDSNGWYDLNAILHASAIASNYYQFTNRIGTLDKRRFRT